MYRGLALKYSIEKLGNLVTSHSSVDYSPTIVSYKKNCRFVYGGGGVLLGRG